MVSASAMRIFCWLGASMKNSIFWMNDSACVVGVTILSVNLLTLHELTWSLLVLLLAKLWFCEKVIPPNAGKPGKVGNRPPAGEPRTVDWPGESPSKATCPRRGQPARSSECNWIERSIRASYCYNARVGSAEARADRVAR